jgi:hypothetical protein
MSDLALSSAAATGRMPRIAEPLRRLFRGWSDPYRPELHYMRGPGPKWREKHGMAPTSASTELGLFEPH